MVCVLLNQQYVLLTQTHRSDDEASPLCLCLLSTNLVFENQSITQKYI